MYFRDILKHSEHEMDGILINLDNIILPTSGKAWKTLLAHVLHHASEDEIMSEIDDDMIKEYIRDEGWQISDLFDDDEVVDYINEAGIPPQHVFDKEYIIGCLDVEDLEGLVKRNLPAVLMECPLIKNQQAKIAELEKKLAEANKALECLGFRTDCKLEAIVEDECERIWRDGLPDEREVRAMMSDEEYQKITAEIE